MPGYYKNFLMFLTKLADLFNLSSNVEVSKKFLTYFMSCLSDRGNIGKELWKWEESKQDLEVNFSSFYPKILRTGK